MVAKKFFVFSGLYAGSTAILKIVGFLVLLSVVQLSSTSNFAAFSLLYAIQQVIISLSNAGVIETTMGLVGENTSSELRTKLFANANGAFLILIIGSTFITTLGLGIFYNNRFTDLSIVMPVIGGGFLLSLSSFLSNLVRLDELHVRSLVLSFIPSLFSFVGGGIGILIFKSTNLFFWWSFFFALSATIPIFLLYRDNLRFHDNLKDTFQILKKTIPFIVIIIVSWLSGYGNNYFIEYLFSSKEVAKFTFIFSLCSIMLMVASAFNQVWLPIFLRIYKELPSNKVEEKNLQFYRGLSSIIGAIAGFVLLSFQTGTRIIGGNLLLYNNSLIEIALLFSTYVLSTPWWHCYTYFLVENKSASLLKLNIVTSIIGLFFLYILMWKLGPIGVYVGFPIQLTIRSLAIIVFSNRKWKVKVNISGIIFGLIFLIVGLLLAKTNLSYVFSVLIYILLLSSITFTFFLNDIKSVFKK